MASELDLPILISQLPQLQQVVGPQILPADGQQMIFGEIVASEQRRNEQKVQTVEKDDELSALGHESEDKRNDGESSSRRRKASTPADSEAEATQASNASPWSGNIINVKI